MHCRRSVTYWPVVASGQKFIQTKMRSNETIKCNKFITVLDVIPNSGNDVVELLGKYLIKLILFINSVLLNLKKWFSIIQLEIRIRLVFCDTGLVT